MTNQLHPITPPEDLLQQLRHNMGTWLDQITIAYQAGADQELEACVEAIKQIWSIEHVVTDYDVVRELRAHRRPKPPTLKEQALAVLNVAHHDVLEDDQIAILRRALESTND
jgi:hypothetical protein